MRTSGVTTPMVGGRAFDAGRALVIAGALSATLFAGFAIGRSTVSNDSRPGADTILAPAPVSPELADRPPHRDRVKWGT